MGDLSQLVLTPSQWLQQTIARNRSSQSQVAAQAGLDTQRLSRWVNGKETIPLPSLLELARQLVPESEFPHVMALATCEAVLVDLKRSVTRFCNLLHIDDAPVVDALISRIVDLVRHEPNIGPRETAETVSRFLTDARAAVRMVIRVVEEDFERPLVSTENVGRHLRYPVNHFVGLLIGFEKTDASPSTTVAGDAFRESILRPIRASAYGLLPDKSGGLVRAHDVHLLSLHGKSADQQFVLDALQREVAFGKNPILRRLAFTGLVLRGDEATAERFLHELKRDAALARANLQFDAIHYDRIPAHLASASPAHTLPYDNTISNVLRHLENRAQYNTLTYLELWKLVELARTVGAEPFRTKRILSRVRGLLELEVPNSRVAIEVRSAFEKALADLVQ